MKTTRTIVVLSAVLLVAVAIFFVLSRRASAPIALARAEQTPPPPPLSMLPRGAGISGAPATGLRKVEAVRNPMAQAPLASEPPFDKMPQASRSRDNQPPPRLPSAVASGGGGSGGTPLTDVKKAAAMTNPREKAHLDTEPYFNKKPQAAQARVEQAPRPRLSTAASGGGGSGGTPLTDQRKAGP